MTKQKLILPPCVLDLTEAIDELFNNVIKVTLDENDLKKKLFLSKLVVKLSKILEKPLPQTVLSQYAKENQWLMYLLTAQLYKFPQKMVGVIIKFF